MKNLIYFIAGVLFVTLISATTVSVMTVKPVTPKNTIVVSGWSLADLKNNMKPYLKSGYIVKDISVGEGCRVVVMEKY